MKRRPERSRKLGKKGREVEEKNGRKEEEKKRRKKKGVKGEGVGKKCI